jgi:hypothetical protein
MNVLDINSVQNQASSEELGTPSGGKRFWSGAAEAQPERPTPNKPASTNTAVLVAGPEGPGLADDRDDVSAP